MKCIRFLLLYQVLFSNFVVAQPLLTKSDILRQSNECFKNFQYDICKNLIFQTEKIQLIEVEKNRYKCQSSLLGLQTELIEAYYFKKTKNSQRGILIPYVIKNC